MALGSILVSAGASLLSGLLGMGSAKKRDAANQAAMRETNAANLQATLAANSQARYDANKMNIIVRARADKAAKVPIVTKESGMDSRVTTTQSSGKDTTSVKSWVDYKGMMKAAEEAGFNPVTWLQNGGLAAYTQGSTTTHYGRRDVSEEIVKYGKTTTVTGSTAMDAALAGQHIPSQQLFQAQALPQETAPGIGEVVGSALTSGANQFLADRSANRDHANAKELLNMQLAGMQRSGSYGGSRSGYVPNSVTAGGATTGGSPIFGNGKAAVNIFGEKFTLPSGFSPASDITDMFGEPAEWLYSPLVTAATAYKYLKDRNITPPSNLTTVPAGWGRAVAEGFTSAWDSIVTAAGGHGRPANPYTLEEKAADERYRRYVRELTGQGTY